MGQLSNLYVSQSYQGLLKLANSATGVTNTLQAVQDGIGNNIPMLVSTSSVVITGSFRGDGSGLTGVTSNVDTGSLVTTSSFNSYTSSNDSRVNSLISQTGSYVTETESGSFMITGSVAGNTLTFTKGDGSQFSLQVNTGSLPSGVVSGSQQIVDLGFLQTSSFNSYTSSNDSKVNSLIASTGSYATTSSLTSLSQSIATTDLGQNNRLTSLESTTSSLQNQINQKLDTGSFNSYTSSNDGKVNSLISATGSYATTGSNNFVGQQNINSSVNITGSLNVTGEITALSASITYLETIYQTSSVIFSSGSNILGDEAGDTQTLFGTVNLPSGPLVVTGSVYSSDIIGTGSLFLKPNQADPRFVEIYNTSPTDTHITASGGQIFLGDDQTYVKVDNYGSVERIDIVAGNELNVSSSVINVTGSLNAPSITGSLQGTASYATNALSSSYAQTASFASNGGVTQILAGPNIIVSPLSGKGQVTISSTGTGTGSFNTATGSYGSFYDTTTQPNPVANTANSMSFNETAITNGVSISGSISPFNTYIKTEDAGIYNIQFSAQVEKTDSGTDEIDIWIRKNGNDLLDTATKLTLTGNSTKVVAAWNWFVPSAANDYYQLIWSSADTGMRLFAEPSSSLHPGIPSVIATANRIDQFLSNTGSFNGDFNGSFTGSLQGTASFATQALSASFAPMPDVSYFATTGSNTFIGNQTITGSVNISGSAEFDLSIEGRQLITGPTAGQTPQLLISGSDFNNRIGRSSAYVNKGNRSFGSGYSYGRLDSAADISETAILNVGVFDEPNFVTDIELLVQVNTGSGIQFQDIRNDTYAYETWLRIAPNTGTNPSPQFVRGLGITGNLLVSGSSNVTGRTFLYRDINEGHALDVDGDTNLKRLQFDTSPFVAGTLSNLGAIRYNNNDTFTISNYSKAQFPSGTFIDMVCSTGSNYGQINLYSKWNGVDNEGLTVANYNGFSEVFINTDKTAIQSSVAVTGSFGLSGSLDVIGSFGLSGSTTVTGSFGLSGSLNTTGSINAFGTGIFNRSSTNGQYFGNSFGGNVGVYDVSNLTEIGLALDGATWTTNWSTGPIMYVNNTSGDTYEGVFGFQNKANYTDGRITSLKPMVFISGATGSFFGDGSGLTGITASAPSNVATTGSNVFVGNQVITGSLILSGSADPELRVIGNTILTGSVQGNVNALSISSNTASLNLNDGNFFTLQLVSGSATHINPSNIKPGQTVNIRVNTTGSATVNFPSSVKQVSGSSYVPTTTTSVDIITLVSFDSSSLFLANVKNLV
jgi:hypothetical protein